MKSTTLSLTLLLILTETLNSIIAHPHKNSNHMLAHYFDSVEPIMRRYSSSRNYDNKKLQMEIKAQTIGSKVDSFLFNEMTS